jgi:hypothetical protein
MGMLQGEKTGKRAWIYGMFKLKSRFLQYLCLSHYRFP